MQKHELKQAMVEARWDKDSRRRESVRAVVGVVVIVGVVLITLVGYGIINNL
jgi:hypothetical protein